MEIASQILSDLTIYMKYAKYIPELKRRETWDEIVTRNKEMHIRKFPELKEEIAELKSTGLEMGHGFTEYERMWTLADMQELHNKALHILYEIDKKIGSNPIEATWK